LLEGLVFADRTGRSVAAAPPAAPVPLATDQTAPSRDTGDDERCDPIRRAMRETMTADVGVQRTEASLLHAEGELDRLTREAQPGAWRTRNQLLVARLITQAARRRRESRGGHRRLDYPPAVLKRETA
jgi:L-aspartate oxidase